jgi:predicted component of type VI protein secretion system
MAIVIPDPEYTLRGVTGEAFGRSYHLLSPTVIGRAPECDVTINAPGLSRRHARLRPTFDGLAIEDLRSANGTFLNGQRIATATARAGDEVAFDQLRFRVYAAAGKQEARPQTGRRTSSSRGWIYWTLLVVAALGAVAALALWPAVGSN